MKKIIFMAVFFLQSAFSMRQPLLRGDMMTYDAGATHLISTPEDKSMYYLITQSPMDRNPEILEYLSRVIRHLAPHNSVLRNISIEEIKKYRKIFTAMMLKADFPYETEYRVVKTMMRTKPVVKITDSELNLALSMFIPEKPERDEQEEDELEDITDKTEVPGLTWDNIYTLRAARVDPQLSAELDRVYELIALMNRYTFHLAAINLFSYMVKKISIP
jgi:hypothetical protein